ncbi:hypothetical protein F3Y22_tig00110187pilonHSYRG00050 [Hibiscus syriacus]|uniref:Pentatricopeptide repeat-containing protein n=1 Tax=Hibiscus syriacus TaxID=106335 RepID=A0A6A3BFE1_HIBSY|nr:pentatricopeptide repeat-containing protein At5g66520-like [Hibiscus syriacus]KAE8714795.1 hypothetical protein F3Y22_tig00110187pilonHSYRG00050 [Hibiscus syriacus]
MHKPIPRKLIIRAVNTWTLAIKNASSPHQALDLYTRMHRQSVPFNSFSILFTLKSCAPLKNPSLISHLHCHILKLGFVSHVYVATSLLNAYVVYCFDDACKLFDEIPDRNIITWNTMITGYSRSGDVNKAYALFKAMPLRDVASWSAMIAGFMNNRERRCGFGCFREMVANGRCQPDEVSVGSVLSGCAHMGSLGLLLGRSVHAFVAKNGWNLTVEIGTVLVNMYAKCGFLKYACIVFNAMQQRNIMTWTALICGSAQHGYSDEALSIFEAMQDMGVKPNEMTFTGVLNACARKGLVEEGHKYFNMIEQYGLELRIHHYGCMVDLYGKAGFLEEAYRVIRTMKIEPNVVIWSSFLSACKDHKQFQMADRVIKQVMETVKPKSDGGVYSLISDLYVLNEKWDDAERVRKLMVNQNVRKTRGSSFIRSS